MKTAVMTFRSCDTCAWDNLEDMVCQQGHTRVMGKAIQNCHAWEPPWKLEEIATEHHWQEKQGREK